MATSKKDKNLFSSIDDTDNTGFASKVNYKSENDLFKSKIFTEIDINYIENNFRVIERIYNTEFNRDWDLNENIFGNYNQLLAKDIVGLNTK